jgi:hypothetical protein
MTHKWKEITDRMSPERAAKVEAKVQEMLKDPQTFLADPQASEEIKEIRWDGTPDKLIEAFEEVSTHLEAEALANKLVEEHLSGMFARETLEDRVKRLMLLGFKASKGGVNPRLLEDALRNILDRE